MRARALGAALIACAATGHASDGPAVQSPGAIDLTAHDVVIMGEVHDNPVHHANQAAWVARLNPRALVFEMLTPDLARIAERSGLSGEALGLALQWEQRGWPDFTMYAPIFAAAPEAAIFGADVPREEIVLAMHEGAAAAMGGAAGLFRLDRPLTRIVGETRESMMAVSHCGALPTEALPGMVEAQRLRDATLAEAVIAALLVAGAPVAVITGNGHARTDWGVPAVLRPALSGTEFPDTSILSIGQLEQPPLEGEPFDVLTLSPAPERGDPCEAFR